MNEVASTGEWDEHQLFRVDGIAQNIGGDLLPVPVVQQPAIEFSTAVRHSVDHRCPSVLNNKTAAGFNRQPFCYQSILDEVTTRTCFGHLRADLRTAVVRLFGEVRARSMGEAEADPHTASVREFFSQVSISSSK